MLFIQLANDRFALKATDKIILKLKFKFKTFC